ncbi:MAG: hypothetical protein KIT84_22005 [Labilithrix sp.]|nr:hypothetical protein [Labilithrix sp.]MCW5813719.1 hypothetical protein [Labilithrix sp.]
MPLLRHLGRVALLAALASPFVPTDAGASVSIAVSFDALVKDADDVAVITPGESHSVWEDGRIFTYTKVHVDQGVAGNDLAAGNDTYVRTMGGVVGKIGQLVDGEAVLTKDKPALLFLRKLKAGSFDVSARGQGQYPIKIDPQTKERRLMRSTAAGMLLPPKPPAVPASGVQTQSLAAGAPVAAPGAKILLAQEVLDNKKIDEGAREIASAWKRLHTSPPQTQPK